MVVEPLNVLIGFASSVLLGKVAFVNVNVPDELVSNSALFSVNFKSSICSADHVLLLADLNNTPAAGCLDTVLLPSKVVSPSLAT